MWAVHCFLVSIFQILVIVGVFLTIAAIFTFVEDLCTKSSKSSKESQSKSNDASSLPVTYNTNDMNIYLPLNATDEIDDSVNEHCMTQIAISNSDNEDMDEESDTTALLRSSG